MNRSRYSRWDGTQQGFDLDADEVMGELADDLIHHGDANAALRRLVQEGFRDRAGRQVQGMRELLERLRQQRRERLEERDLGGVYDDIAQRLRNVIDTEHAGIDALEEAARDSGDQRRLDAVREAAAERRLRLDLLPPDLAGQLRALSGYDFASPEARERFEALVEELRGQVVQSFFNQMAGAMGNVSAEELARTKDMLAELNRMLEQRSAGEEPDFSGFMARYGDMFPENPRTLDELLEILVRRMAATQAMLNSMTPGQRAQLQSLSDQLLADMDLRWQMDQLGASLRAAFPDAGWERTYDFSGTDLLSWGEAAEVLGELGDLDQLEQLLRGASAPGALAEVDVERARELLGDDAAASLEQMAELARMLADAGFIEQREGRLELTPAAIRRIGAHALSELFARIGADVMGGHEVHRVGVGHERASQSKAYEYGDPFNLDIHRTVRNAVQRNGGGTPVHLDPDDFEVEQTEMASLAATVVMLDVSLSMEMRGNFLAAKKVALALHALITGQFPRDYLGMVSFGKLARELRPEQLPEVSWDFDFGTNMQHGLALARRMLARQRGGTRQIIMITDGEPTAHVEAGTTEPFFHYPPLPETVDATLAEVNRCTRQGIRINTFMLDATAELRHFVEQLTRLNRGRAFYTTPETLGDYVLVDFLDTRRAVGRRGGSGRRHSA
ncbi:MAG TPA: VWA domain-containing protein [Acidimicrobiales bacterium]|nr:VWA domain-containing protein [Acidimicrobiales bacterium]